MGSLQKRASLLNAPTVHFPPWKSRKIHPNRLCTGVNYWGCQPIFCEGLIEQLGQRRQFRACGVFKRGAGRYVPYAAEKKVVARLDLGHLQDRAALVLRLDLEAGGVSWVTVRSEEITAVEALYACNFLGIYHLAAA